MKNYLILVLAIVVLMLLIKAIEPAKTTTIVRKVVVVVEGVTREELRRELDRQRRLSEFDSWWNARFR